MSAPPSTTPLDVTRVTTAPVWGPIEYAATLDSTNAECLRGPTPWRIVVAEEQSAGRGRLQRTWTTTPYTSLAVSAVMPLPPGLPLTWVPLLAGLALRRAVEQVAHAQTSVKWPNDLLAGDPPKKLAGILCQWSPAGVVIGMGINVDGAEQDLPVESATSLRALGYVGVSREELLGAYLSQLAALSLTPLPTLAAEYRRGCATLGAEIDIHDPGGGVRRAVATDIDQEGRLMVEIDHTVLSVSAGDVVHVREVR